SGSNGVGFRRLFEPMRIGDFTVRNRIVNPAHSTGLNDERDIRYLTARARGGAGLLGVNASVGIGEYAMGPRAPTTHDGDARPLSPVTPEGIAHYDATVIPRLRRRAEVIHAEGAHCFAQVAHSGAAHHQQRIDAVIAPSAVPDPYEAHVPHPLSDAEIDQ